MKSTGTDTDREPSIAGLRLLASHDARIGLRAPLFVALTGGGASSGDVLAMVLRQE